MSHSPRIYIRGVSETIPDTETGFSLIFDRPADLANPITQKTRRRLKNSKTWVLVWVEQSDSQIFKGNGTSGDFRDRSNAIFPHLRKTVE